MKKKILMMLICVGMLSMACGANEDKEVASDENQQTEESVENEDENYNNSSGGELEESSEDAADAESEEVSEEETPAGETIVEEPSDTHEEGPQNYTAEYRVEEGYLAPDFAATLSDGTVVNLSDLQGAPVILNFWASWCGPCCNEMPAFQWLSDEYGSNLTVLAVNCGESVQTIQSFASTYGYTFPMAVDQYYDISNLYPTSGIPYTIIIDSYGVIRHITVGASDAQSMYEYYKSCLESL